MNFFIFQGFNSIINEVRGGEVDILTVKYNIVNFNVVLV